MDETLELEAPEAPEITNIIPFGNLAHHANELSEIAFALATGVGMTEARRADAFYELDNALRAIRICVRLVREQLGPEVGELFSDTVRKDV